MKLIASTELWMSRIVFDAPHTHEQVQAQIRQCAKVTGVSIVGLCAADIADVVTLA